MRRRFGDMCVAVIACRRFDQLPRLTAESASHNVSDNMRYKRINDALADKSYPFVNRHSVTYEN